MAASGEGARRFEGRPRPIVAVHGGAGRSFERPDDPVAMGGVAALRRALSAAGALLASGAGALEAVVVAVTELEEAEELNAGRGSVLTSAGTVECDAAVAVGDGRRAGAVAVTRRVRHPVALAGRVLAEEGAVLVVGSAADELASLWGLELVDPSFFVTARREAEWREGAAGPGSSRGTVGAVALDAAGHLAAATSTGGVAGQRPGRVGDSPIVGAGTFADDRSCAVSATGDGEAFLRASFTHDVHARMAYGGRDLATACEEALVEVAGLGGRGGCIALGAAGELVLAFSTPAMFRGWHVPGGSLVAGVGPAEVPPPPPT